MFSTQKLLGLLLAFVCVCFACCGAPGKRELLIYTPHGKDLLQDFKQRYEAANPEVSVNFVDMGSREILERVRAERFRPQADLWWGASQMTFADAAEENLLAAYRPTWADKVAPEARDAADFWYGTYETPEVIVYNSDVLTADTAPQDWDEVLGEKWRDKIILRDPLPSDTMRVIFGSLILREDSPEKGFEWLRRLDANTKEYAANPTILLQKLARQEGLVSLYNLPDARLFREQKNLPINYLLPRSGTPVVVDAIAVLNGAPHEAEARRFYEFVTTPENLQYAAEKYYRLPVSRSDLDRKKLPAWMQTDFKRMKIDWNALRKNGSEWMQFWNSNIRGRSR
jgi:iron(III) transport system substrate-binding protein